MQIRMNQLVVVAGRELVVIARVNSPTGLKGCVKITPIFFNPSELNGLVAQYSDDIYFLKNKRFPKKVIINKISATQKDLKLELDGICSRSQAEDFVSALVACSTTSYYKYLKYTKSVFRYIGYMVRDVNLGDVGLIEDITRQGQILFYLRTLNDRQVLVPFVDSFLKKLDDKNKIILMDLPEGLV